MKFDYCIGNPPYQKETNKQIIEKGQVPSTNIFHIFQIEMETISNKTCLIYPAGRWIQRTGKGMKNFSISQLNDPHLEELIVFPNPFDVFPGIRIADGVSIVFKNMRANNTNFKYTYIRDGISTSMSATHPGEDLFPMNPQDFSIIDKIKKFVSNNNLKYLSESIQPRTIFGIESNFVEENPDKVRLYREEDKLAVDEIKLFSNDVAGKGGTPRWYIINRKDIPRAQNCIDKWKVIGSSINISSTKQMDIFPPNTAFGRSRIGIKFFDGERESTNFFKYLKSSFILYTLMISGGSLTSGGKFTPDLDNYIDNSIIDFDKDIDVQFREILHITNDEWNYLSNYRPIYV